VLKACALAVLALSLGSCGKHEKTATYRDARYGWTITYPASMTRHVVDDSQPLVSWHGVLVANSSRVRAEDGVYFRRFPPDGAAFTLTSMAGGPAPDLSPPEARFPLSRDDFEPVRGAPPPVPLFHGMIANGEPWQVIVWFGPKASSSDKERIWKIVESIDFPPQRPGTTSGHFYVLGDASRYPPGSVVKFPGKQSADDSSYVPAFYLVHAPKGMYAVGWTPTFERTCNMGVDRKRMTFFCSAGRGRWNRVGDALQSPGSDELPDDVLWLGQAKVGRDGQVLVGNWTEPGNYGAEERRFWP
jgi:hypothetical protein